MAVQVRAIRTRQAILAAAAKVFEEQGYRSATISEILATAGVTKGALYFHFGSKEDLAQGVLAEQDPRIAVPPRPTKTQELVDTIMLHAHRIQTDPMVRAGVRLSMDQRAQGLDRSLPFLRWGKEVVVLLERAQAQGELLPHVVLEETADMLVGAFGGIQSMSQAICDHRDLAARLSVLLRHVLPSVAQPSVLAALQLGEDRGAVVYTEVTQHTHPGPTDDTPTTTPPGGPTPAPAPGHTTAPAGGHASGRAARTRTG